MESGLLMRQTAASIPYLILYFILPFLKPPTARTMSGCTGCYLQWLIAISVINVLCQSGDQSEIIVREIGFISFNNLPSLSLVLMISPDVIMLLTSTIFYLIIQKSLRKAVDTNDPQNQLFLEPKVEEFFTEKVDYIASKTKFLALILLCFTGALRPSASNGVYFIIFLGGVTWWACFKKLGKVFSVVSRLACLFSAVHITALLSYQTQSFQTVLKPDSPFIRYFGLTALKVTDCTDPRNVRFNNLEWTYYANPVSILILYFVLGLQKFNYQPSKNAEDVVGKGLARTFSERLSQRRRLARNPTINWRTGNRKVRDSIVTDLARGSSCTEKTPLINSVGRRTKYRATSVTSENKNENNPRSSIISNKERDNIQLKNLSVEDSIQDSPTCMELAVDGFISLCQLLIRSSYIATNIVMMAWSITYHSWLTFILLLWASLLWMIPNQRRSMLRSSPYIVVYAEFLLLSQYIFAMDLTEEELPTVVNEVRLDHIGFVKPLNNHMSPILVKTLFTFMFLLTMRQFCRERKEEKENSNLYDLSAPLRLSANTASGPPQPENQNAIWIKNLGVFVKKLMTKFWIWVVAISLFVIGVTGKRITVFRIVYMGLFLFFILTFQISYRAWRRMMYGFWLTVIIYSMQLDIGLESFETAELFVRLLAPTFFVVITVVQLHYFHKEFLAISDLGNRGASISRGGKGSSRSDGSSVLPDESVLPCSELTPDDVPLLGLQKISFRNLRQILLNVVELIILFLELHMLKIVIFSIMLLCCYNVSKFCPTHIVLVVLCIVALMMSSKIQTTITLICSSFIAILLLLTMIYQIQYIQQDVYDVFPDSKIPFVANNSEWLGFKKATDEVSLVNLLQGYIAVFAVITFHAVINTRQRINRRETGRTRPYILFQGITREMADSSVKNCLKFLTNYGFYKFGVEICLIATVGVIGSRMDFFGLVYAAWLLILFGLSRSSLSYIWNSYKIFIAVMICLQYLIVVGAPPGLCIDYPWYYSETLRRLQEWMFLPDPIKPPSSYKILCDVILLILVSRQSLCFRIERRNKLNYPGGSNEVIIQNYGNVDFENPYIDHMTYTKSSLDLLKKGIFSALLWITLAVTFTAGTSRVNILSIGYLIGSFIFLWQGNDLYLRRIQSILKWWSWLLGYNVIVILTKTILQIAGCIFMEIVQENACWVVQLLGIGCINKFGDLGTLGTSKEALQCTVPDSDIGLAWDGLCFSFLIMQRRFFHSYYFFHHIDETKAMTVLQSRGAQLIEELRQQQLQEQQSQERKVLEKIRHKMDRIKASQQKASNVSSYKPSHYEEAQAPLAVQSPGVSSSCSPRGYHTPVSEEAPRTILQVPTPISAIMTTMDGYLEPQRMSFSSPPNSELNPRYSLAVAVGKVRHFCMDGNLLLTSSYYFSRFFTPAVRNDGNVFELRSKHDDSDFIVELSLGQRNAPSFYRLASPLISPIITSSDAIRVDVRPNKLVSIRSGDYYMFEDIDDEELDLIKEDEDESSSSEGDETDGKKRFTMSKFLSTALKTDITKAADQALTTEEIITTRPARPRRASMPASMLLRKSSMGKKVGGPSSVLSAPAGPSTGFFKTRKDTVRLFYFVSRKKKIRSSITLPSDPSRSDPQQPPQQSSGDKGDDDYSDDGFKYVTSKAGIRINETKRKEEEQTTNNKHVFVSVKEKITQKLWQSFKVLWAFVESAMVSMIRTLNKISKDYRYVVRVLAQEKRDVKENEEFKKGSRLEVSKVWKPDKEILLQLGEIITATSPGESIGRRGSGDESTTIVMDSPKEDKERLNRPALSTITESEDQDIESEVTERPRLGRTDSLLPDIRIIAPSQERGLDYDYFVYDKSHCVINFLNRSLFVSLLVVCFSESCKNFPRSSDTDTGREEWSAANSPIWLQLMLASWYAIISHSELVCYFVIFLHQIKSPTLLSLPLPLMVFLWGSLTMPRPTKTFWITLIAYTEIVVIIKCMFQFDLLPWNQTLSPENNPFYPPRIIGVEKKPSYASSDLLLLLIIFFHRYMLKSLGLWKSTQEDILLSHVESGYNFHELIRVDESKNVPPTILRKKKFMDGGIHSSGHIKTESQFNLINEGQDDTSEGDSFDKKSDIYGENNETHESTTDGGKMEKFKKSFLCITKGGGDESEKTEYEKSLYPRHSEAFEKFPTYFNEARAQYCSTTKNFFSQLLDTGSRLSADVYAYMFICDFFNFLVVLFGFSAFGTQQGDGGVSAYLEENKVPVPFLLMMILQFGLIVIDRALYLRKYILGKIIFQFVLVIGVHLWMFFILPAITERPFNQLLPPQMWYTVKCFYLLMSAYQIRAGYPTRILGNFLCKKYNYINMFSFRGFMAVPFLFELRALMDWIWTDTSMTLSDWLKMEDIFAQIFQLKCQRRAEAEYPLPRGERKSPLSKYLLGGAGLFLIIAIIWFPLVLFALGNTVGESNIPYDVTISLRIGAYQYIYEMSAQNNTIYKYSEHEFDTITNMYKKNRDREAVTFLSNYQFDDVAVVKLSGNSTVVWGISPPDRELLLQEVESSESNSTKSFSDQTVSIKFSWRVSRVNNNPETVGVVMGERQIFLQPFVNGERNPKRIELSNMLKTSNSSQTPVVIENILPKFLKITNKGNADPISKLMAGDRDNATFRNISISLKTGESNIGITQQWWEVRETCDDENYKNILSRLPLNECNLFLTMFTFNDKAFPATLSFISGKGIIGLYVSIVFVMWTLVRGFFTGISFKIMFDDMPNVDRILQLCLDIYLVRESNEFALEEDLFAKLVFLYRSPETIIKWTKERREIEDDEDGADGSQLPWVEN
ncbi:conserved hypothetical protein [Pediculus humanus corporis]|uniref:Piezo-type mechanosensitive ion channel component n=2 Tax=Pediculus humanus subsp. corporis TaxID=121224 RepID=E0VVE2_PEDHC|nr:uncharacterized protein Phum_PHUM462560 [Pediculus humanus corporis]EEB17348.1 conserved hypothetical protein [Pediculus humanus corporis]